MRGTDHVTIAAITGAGVVWLASRGSAPVGTYAAVAGATALGALVPDIDHPKSLIGNGLPAQLFTLGFGVLLAVTVGDLSLRNQPKGSMSRVMTEPLLAAVRPYLGWAWLAVGIGLLVVVISLLVTRMLEHRGPTHSLLAGAVLTLLAIVAFAVARQPVALGLWFGWGYLSHLLTDSMTPMGCPAMLWPFRPGDRLGWEGMPPVPRLPKLAPSREDERPEDAGDEDSTLGA